MKRFHRRGARRDRHGEADGAQAAGQPRPVEERGSGARPRADAVYCEPAETSPLTGPKRGGAAR